MRRRFLPQLRKEIAKHDPFRWANVTDHDDHMCNATTTDDEPPFQWKYRARPPDDVYDDPIFDVDLTDWAPPYEKNSVFYLDLNKDETSWRQVVNKLKEQVDLKSVPNWNLSRENYYWVAFWDEL